MFERTKNKKSQLEKESRQHATEISNYFINELNEKTNFVKLITSLSLSLSLSLVFLSHYRVVRRNLLSSSIAAQSVSDSCEMMQALGMACITGPMMQALEMACITGPMMQALRDGLHHRANDAGAWDGLHHWTNVNLTHLLNK